MSLFFFGGPLCINLKGRSHSSIRCLDSIPAGWPSAKTAERFGRRFPSKKTRRKLQKAREFPSNLFPDATNVWNIYLPRASRTSKKVGPVKKHGVLEEEPGSSKPIFYIWVLYGLNTGFVRFKYGFCADETHLFWQKPGFSTKLKKNRVFEKKNLQICGFLKL